MFTCRWITPRDWVDHTSGELSSPLKWKWKVGNFLRGWFSLFYFSTLGLESSPLQPKNFFAWFQVLNAFSSLDTKARSFSPQFFIAISPAQSHAAWARLGFHMAPRRKMPQFSLTHLTQEQEFYSIPENSRTKLCKGSIRSVAPFWTFTYASAHLIILVLLNIMILLIIMMIPNMEDISSEKGSGVILRYKECT